jgi:hypothetical protein
MRVLITAPGGYVSRKRGIDLGRGVVADLPDELALKLVRIGHAIPAPAPEPETAVRPAPPQNAAKRTGKPATKKTAKGGEE